MGRQSAYKLRARLDGQPFGAAWRMAMRSALDTVREAAIDRAVNGVEVPHYWQGELVGTSRRYDERLTALLLTSGALDCRPRPQAPAEKVFAQQDFSTLLARIEHGPTEWDDLELDAEFAFDDYAAIGADSSGADSAAGDRFADDGGRGDDSLDSEQDGDEDGDVNRVRDAGTHADASPYGAGEKIGRAECEETEHETHACDPEDYVALDALIEERASQALAIPAPCTADRTRISGPAEVSPSQPGRRNFPSIS